MQALTEIYLSIWLCSSEGGCNSALMQGPMEKTVKYLLLVRVSA